MGDLAMCFLWICRQDTNYWCNHVFVYPCTVCSFHTNISLNRVRNAMKRLANYGYVKRDSEGGYDEWNGRIFCCHGYAVTKKGRGTAIYRKIERQAIEEIERSLREYD